jgi:hypothetical protein
MLLMILYTQMAELTDKPIVVAETSTVPGIDVDKGTHMTAQYTKTKLIKQDCSSIKVFELHVYGKVASDCSCVEAAKLKVQLFSSKV